MYSTNPSFQYEYEGKEESETLPPERQTLWVRFEKKHRAGKKVTLISGFIGLQSDLKALEKKLKAKCGAGGAVKNGEILVQGDVREKVMHLLRGEGYKVKG